MAGEPAHRVRRLRQDRVELRADVAGRRRAAGRRSPPRRATPAASCAACRRRDRAPPSAPTSTAGSPAAARTAGCRRPWCAAARPGGRWRRTAAWPGRRAGRRRVSACIESKKYWNVTCHIAACIAVIAGSVVVVAAGDGANRRRPTRAPRPAGPARCRPPAASPAAQGPPGSAPPACCSSACPGRAGPTPSRWAWTVSSCSSAASLVAAAAPSRTPKTTRRVSAAAIGRVICWRMPRPIASAAAKSVCQAMAASSPAGPTATSAGTPCRSSGTPAGRLGSRRRRTASAARWRRPTARRRRPGRRPARRGTSATVGRDVGCQQPAQVLGADLAEQLHQAVPRGLGGEGVVAVGAGGSASRRWSGRARSGRCPAGRR